ncbi:MAG TPA: hypothetical protein VIX37_14850 [Candidatus Sulfotelmatobacter sp.]
MKIGSRRLRMSSGKIRKFRNAAARARFERLAQAIKHGWRPSSKR